MWNQREDLRNLKMQYRDSNYHQMYILRTRYQGKKLTEACMMHLKLFISLECVCTNSVTMAKQLPKNNSAVL